MSVEAFYDGLAPIYHLIYPDWEASIQRQAGALDSLIREHWGEGKLRILDVACGIGTQALGLAGPNWEVYGHWHDDPSQLRTDVFYLLQDAGEPGG